MIIASKRLRMAERTKNTKITWPRLRKDGSDDKNIRDKCPFEDLVV